MTVTVPRWMLIALAVGVAAVTAFLIGRSTNDSDETAVATSAGDAPDADTGPVPLPCNEQTAASLAAKSEFAQGFPDGRLPGYLPVNVESCRDLNGDGLDEMVVRIHGSTGSAVAPLTIYGQEEARWRPRIVRMLSNNDLARVTPDGIREITAAYGPSEPSCCPSGVRRGFVSWDGSEYVYEPDAGVGDGRIRMENSAVVSIGPFQTMTGTPSNAIDAFGVPSSYVDDGEICTMAWKDTGLTIDFVDLGSSNACGRAGSVGSFFIADDPAEQSGWTIAEGLHVGSTQDDIRAQFPHMRPLPLVSAEYQRGPQGRDWSLVDRPNPYTGRKGTSLSVRLDRGDAVAYSAYVGAGGE